MMPKELVLAPLGLITRPNHYGQFPAGALAAATNVCMRHPGTLQPLPARLEYAANGGGNVNVDRIWSTESTLLVHAQANGLFQVTGASRNAVTLPTGWTLDKQYARYMRARGRHFVGTAGGPVVLDSATDTTARQAGISTPPRIGAFFATTAATDHALANNTNANYRAIILRRHSDGYFTASAPTNVANVSNMTGATASLTFAVVVRASVSYEVGDIIELYRTDSQATGTEPGARYRLCATHILTAGDLAGGVAQVVDNCTDAALGTELYTNPGQPSASARYNRCPSLATDMAQFKGYTFYATPYSHVRGVFKIRGSVGVLGANVARRANGIGTRFLQGDFTIGNAAILNVAPLTGIVVGQELSQSPVIAVPVGATIVSIVGTTVTMSAPATATAGASPFDAHDRIEVGGTVYRFGSLYDLSSSLGVGDVRLRTDSSLRQVAQAAGIGNVYANGYEDGVTVLFEDAYFAPLGSTSLTFRATNGQNYDPPLNALTGTVYTYPFAARYNRLTVSKLDQPEHVPDENELTVGSGTSHRLIATRDALFVFCSDGLYRITGDAGVFRVELLDATLRLATRASVDTMLNVVWAYTNRGLVTIGPGGVDAEVSAERLGDILPGSAITDEATDASTTQFTTFLTCDPTNREVRLCIRAGGSNTTYLYNTLTDRFTAIVDTGALTEVCAEAFAPYLNSIVWSVTNGGGSTPIYRYQTSTATRSDDVVQFQPIAGDKQPFTLKQWTDFEFLFRSVNAGSGFTIDTSVNDDDAAIGIASTNIHSEYRFVSGFPLAHGMSPSVKLGFRSRAQGASGWQLIGMAARWSRLSEQVQK